MPTTAMAGRHCQGLFFPGLGFAPLPERLPHLFGVYKLSPVSGEILRHWHELPLLRVLMENGDTFLAVAFVSPLDKLLEFPLFNLALYVVSRFFSCLFYSSKTSSRRSTRS